MNDLTGSLEAILREQPQPLRVRRDEEVGEALKKAIVLTQERISSSFEHPRPFAAKLKTV